MMSKEIQGSKAVAYLRVSGKGQLKQSGFSRQRDSIKEFARVHNVEIVSEYRDEGVSGTKDGFDREGLTDLFDRIQGNGVRLVLVEHADRLARDLIVQELIVQEFERLGARVIACESGTDLASSNSDPTKKLVRQILGAIAEFEKSRLVSKLKIARDRKRRNTGKCEGQKLFGSLDGEEATLKRIRELYRKPRNGSRRSLKKIAETLNSEDHPTRSGKPWSRGSVWSIVQRF